MKDIKHYFQSSPPSCFDSSVSPSTKDVELSMNIKSKVNGHIRECNVVNGKMISSSDIEVLTVESNDSETSVKENDKTDSDKPLQSPNAFQILMSTQQVFSSTNSGKIESAEVIEEKEPTKHGSKRKIKESLELMSKRKLEMERSCRSPETTIDRPSKKRRRIIEESDSDDDKCVKPVKLKTSVVSPQNSGKGKNKLKLPELDIIVMENSGNLECKNKQTSNSDSTKSDKDDLNKSINGDVKDDDKHNEVKLSEENVIEKSKSIELENESSPRMNRKTKTVECTSAKNKKKSKAQTISNKNKKTVKVKSKDVETHISDCEEDSELLCSNSKQDLKSVNGTDNPLENKSPSNKSAKKVKKKSMKIESSENISGINESTSVKPCKKNNSISEEDIFVTKSKISFIEKESVNCESSNILDVDTKTPSISDAKRRSNIMNYFNKVSNEDARRQPDKIKVKADVHFPFTTLEKSSRKSITKSKTKKKKGVREGEDDIVVVDSEIIEKPLEADSTDASKQGEGSSTNISKQLPESEKKDSVSEDAVELKSTKSLALSDWRMRIRLSDGGVDTSPKKRTTKETTPQSYKRLKLSSNTSRKQEKTSQKLLNIMNKRENNSTVLLTDTEVIEEPIEMKRSTSLPASKDKDSESIKETGKPLPKQSSLVSKQKRRSSSKKKSDSETSKESAFTPISFASIGKNKEVSKKNVNKLDEGSDSRSNGFVSVDDEGSVASKKKNTEGTATTPKKSSSKGKSNVLLKKTETSKESVSKPKGPGDKNKPGMKQSSLMFKSLSSTSMTSSDGKKGSDENPVIDIEEEKSVSEKYSPGPKKSKPESKTSSAIKRKSVVNDKESEDRQDIALGPKKSTDKESTSSIKVSSSENKSSKQTLKTEEEKSTLGKKFTPKRAAKTNVTDSTPTRKGSPNKRVNSVEKSVSTKKQRLSRKENVELEEKSEESGDGVEVLNSPVRSRRSCTLPKDPPQKRVTPNRKGTSPRKQKEVLQEDGTNPDSRKRKGLRLRLKRVVSVDEESSDSWRSVSPEPVVELEEDGDDEDEPIFVRKKKKKVVDEGKVTDADILQMMAERKAIQQAIKKARGGTQIAKVKLAPVFMKQKFKKPDKVTLQAKKNFLQSGVPEEVKKMVEIQKLAEEAAEEYAEFPSVSHVQQRDELCGNAWALEDMLHKFPCDSEPDAVEVPSQIPVGCFTKCNRMEDSEMKQYSAGRPPQINAFRDFLRSIKAESPDFPVYRMFRNLYCLLNPPVATDATKAKRKQPRRSRSSAASSRKSLEGGDEESKTPDAAASQASWSSKYRPQSSEEILGNGQSVKKLKNWLEMWVQAKEGHTRVWSDQSDAGSEDDFIHDESDDDNKVSLPKNPVVILGPNGSGKTMTVYTLARELGFKVLEVNAAAKRTGRRILSELLEATQSHQVQSKGDESSQSIKNFFSAKQKPATKKAKQKLKEKEKEKQSNKLSLILVEDVDVVFEDQDEGFLSALSTLVAVSKRPIVLISSDPSCPHLSRFTEKSLVLEFNPVNPKLLGVWLQLICLLEGLRVKHSTMEDLLLQNRGDVRKSLMQLQFWVLSGGNILQPLTKKTTEPEELEAFSDDSSNSSWISAMDKKTTNEGMFPFHSGCAQVFLSPDPCSTDVNRGRLWWNIPSVLGLNPVLPSQLARSIPVEGDEPVAAVTTKDSDSESIDAAEPSETSVKVTNVVVGGGEAKGAVENDDAVQWKSVCADEDLSAVSSLMDTLSVVESLSRVSEPPSPLWETAECLWESDPVDSLSLNQDLRCSRFAEEQFTRNLGGWLVAESVGQCADRLQPNEEGHMVATKLQRNVSDHELRWRRDHHAASLELAEAVPMSYCIERRAFSMDYVSSLRNISRLEQGRSCVNDKRNNRFFHYLKGLGVDPMSGMLETACTAFLSNVNS